MNGFISIVHLVLKRTYIVSWHASAARACVGLVTQARSTWPCNSLGIVGQRSYDNHGSKAMIAPDTRIPNTRIMWTRRDGQWPVTGGLQVALLRISRSSWAQTHSSWPAIGGPKRRPIHKGSYILIRRPKRTIVCRVPMLFSDLSTNCANERSWNELPSGG